MSRTSTRCHAFAVCCRWSQFGRDFASHCRRSNSSAWDNGCKAQWDLKYCGERLPHSSCTNICHTTNNAPVAAVGWACARAVLYGRAAFRVSTFVRCECVCMRLIEHFSHFETKNLNDYINHSPGTSDGMDSVDDDIGRLYPACKRPKQKLNFMCCNWTAQL